MREQGRETEKRELYTMRERERVRKVERNGERKHDNYFQRCSELQIHLEISSLSITSHLNMSCIHKTKNLSHLLIAPPVPTHCSTPSSHPILPTNFCRPLFQHPLTSPCSTPCSHPQEHHGVEDSKFVSIN